MSRIERIGDATLYLGDCLEILPTLGRVDAVITDPPFGVGFKYESHDDDPESYPTFIWPRIEAAEALCNPGSPVFVWQGMPNAHRLSAIFPRKFRLFAACKDFITYRPTPMQFSWDPVVCWWTDGAGKYRNPNFGRDWHLAHTATRHLDRVDHPCPRPVDQVSYVVQKFVRPGGTVLDPFMGSATTGVACAKSGRPFVGIEVDQKYFDVCCDRIESAYKQSDMFVERPKKPEQPDMLGGDAA